MDKKNKHAFRILEKTQAYQVTLLLALATQATQEKPKKLIKKRNGSA